MSTIEIELSLDEVHLGAIAGIGRRMDSLKAGLTNRKQSDMSDWDVDIDGACAELAVAKVLNVFWFGHMRSFKGPDVGNLLHIRSTRHTNGHLIIKHNDDPNGVYMLVINECPKFTIVGGISAKRAMRDFPSVANKVGKGHSFWVPQDKLSDAEVIVKAYRLTS
jgi:hypothetical protein